MTRPILTPPGSFAAQTIDKVERLLELLSEIDAHRYLGPRLVLHGGTALNVFHLDIPRLSVDIDILYVGSVEREIMLSERATVQRELETILRKMGYVFNNPKDEHAGVTYKLSYGTDYGRDSIKVDLNFLNRSPLLGYEVRACPRCAPQVSFKVVPYLELVSGKMKALLERRRAAIRDLYDVFRVATTGVADLALLRALVVYYWSMAEPFPCALNGSVVDRFAGQDRALESELFPVLVAEERPTLAEMQETVAAFVDSLAQLSDEQQAYLKLMGDAAEYRPELLFGDWPEVLERAQVSRAARWKVDNLAKRSEEARGRPVQTTADGEDRRMNRLHEGS